MASYRDACILSINILEEWTLRLRATGVETDNAKRYRFVQDELLIIAQDGFIIYFFYFNFHTKTSQ